MRLSRRKYSPYSETWTQRRPVALLLLLGINAVFFITHQFLEAYQPGFVRDFLGMSDQGVRSAFSWQFITAMFLHSGPWHFLWNMLLLYLLGRDLQLILGERHFLYLYLMGGVAGELFHLFMLPSETVLLGASGGVMAVLMAYATVLPELELTSSLFFILPLRLKAKHIATAVFLFSFLLLGIDRNGVVIYSAWLGGLLTGWFYAHLLGFGPPSFAQRIVHRRRAAQERYERMSLEQLMNEEVDPVLEKISRKGMGSLTRAERQSLALARQKMLQKAGE